MSLTEWIMTMKTLNILPFALCLLFPLAAQAQSPGKPGTSINAEVREELAGARMEAHAEFVKAKQELETENLRVDNGIRIGTPGNGESVATKANLARAEITPQGDFLIDGKPQKLDAGQRQRLLAYRGLVVEIAKAGIDVGQHTAEAMFKEVDHHWVGLLFSAVTGGLDSRIKRTVRQELEPGVLGICRLLPRVMDSQQRLASSLSQFQPYATLDQKDIDGCEKEVRSGFASL